MTFTNIQKCVVAKSDFYFSNLVFLIKMLNSFKNDCCLRVIKKRKVVLIKEK